MNKYHKKKEQNNYEINNDYDISNKEKNKK